MTKHERQEVRKAISELMSDNCDFDWALARLCKLVGIKVNGVEVRKITIRELYAMLKARTAIQPRKGCEG